MDCPKKRVKDLAKEYQTYLVILISIIILYSICARFSYLYHQMHVPRGDPFSYTVNFFLVLDQLNSNLLKTLARIYAGGSWYWLIYTQLAIFSPMLFKEPYALALINFGFFTCASFVFYTLGRQLNYQAATAFLLAGIIWLFPSNYGFLHPTSLSQMQLDTAFLFILMSAVGMTLRYALSPSSRMLAWGAGLLVGLSIWGRGNSLPFVAIALFVPVLYIVYQAIKQPMLRSNAKHFIGVFAGLGLFFYIQNWRALKRYYGVHAGVFEKTSLIDWQAVKHLLIAHPGKFLASSPAYYGIGTLFCHAIVVGSLLMCAMLWQRDKRPMSQALLLVSATGAMTFYGALAFVVLAFSNQNFYAAHNFLLLQIGFSFGAFALLGGIIWVWCENKGGWQLSAKQNFVAALLISGGLLSYSQHFTKKNGLLAPAAPSTATPQEVAHFASGLDAFLEGKKLSFLWYEMYNLAIVNYYRVKNSQPPIDYYQADHLVDLWQPPFLPENKESILEAFKKTIEEADFVILPEFSSDFYSQEAYPLYHIRDEMEAYLNSEAAPELVVRWVLHEDGDVRLLMLQKQSDALAQGLSQLPKLHKPYGKRNQVPRIDYPVLSDKASYQPRAAS